MINPCSPDSPPVGGSDASSFVIHDQSLRTQPGRPHSISKMRLAASKLVLPVEEIVLNIQLENEVAVYDHPNIKKYANQKTAKNQKQKNNK